MHPGEGASVSVATTTTSFPVSEIVELKEYLPHSTNYDHQSFRQAFLEQQELGRLCPGACPFFSLNQQGLNIW